MTFTKEELFNIASMCKRETAFFNQVGNVVQGARTEGPIAIVAQIAAKAVMIAKQMEEKEKKTGSPSVEEKKE